MQRERCANDNHGRAIVKIRCCPDCGGIVNKKIGIRSCPDEEHARARRVRYVFCVNCGEPLMAGGVRR